MKSIYILNCLIFATFLSVSDFSVWGDPPCGSEQDAVNTAERNFSLVKNRLKNLEIERTDLYIQSLGVPANEQALYGKKISDVEKKIDKVKKEVDKARENWRWRRIFVTIVLRTPIAFVGVRHTTRRV